MRLLMLLFTSLYFSDPSDSNRFFLFSPFVTQIKNFCSDPGFFLLMMFAKDLTGCFSYCCVEGGDHCIHICIFTVRNGERCKLPTYYRLEGFQHVGIFQLFEVKLESFVFWLADFFSGEGERSSLASHGHFQSLLLENFLFWQCSFGPEALPQ